MTKKQTDEITFLEQYGKFRASSEEKEAYIQATVHGRGSGQDKFSENRLRNVKQRFNVMLSIWKEDLQNGLLGYWELLDDPILSGPYPKKVIKAMLLGLERPEYNGYMPTTRLAVVNYNYKIT